jgi:predicted nucleic acid-binding protein
MNADIFVDTNILLYAHDIHEGAKHRVAKDFVQGWWERDESPTVSVQILQELHVNLLRKQFSIEESRKMVSDYLQWNVVSNDLPLFLEALETQKRYHLSFWDASIIAAAQSAGCKTLWTEDLQEGQRFGKLTIHNPLHGSSR